MCASEASSTTTTPSSGLCPTPPSTGQERDIILISLVRSNDSGQIGFLRDLRRMNVAITRARMKLIILGNADTMTRHPFYRRLWDYIQTINHDNQS